MAISDSAVSAKGASARGGGFTLVELMIVVVIIGILAAIAIPAFRHVREQSRNARIVNNYRVLANAFETYATKHGEWPDDVSRGTFPPEMEGFLKPEELTEATVVGGHWDWEGPDSVGLAGVTLRSGNVDEEQAREIDEKLDDGNLSTGHFVEGAVAGGGYTYVLDRP